MGTVVSALPLDLILVAQQRLEELDKEHGRATEVLADDAGFRNDAEWPASIFTLMLHQHPSDRDCRVQVLAFTRDFIDREIAAPEEGAFVRLNGVHVARTAGLAVQERGIRHVGIHCVCRR